MAHDADCTFTDDPMNTLGATHQEPRYDQRERERDTRGDESPQILGLTRVQGACPIEG